MRRSINNNSKGYYKPNYNKGNDTGNRGNENNWNNGRRINSDWIKGVKGCFVCGQDHRANTRHSREEVTEAVNKLKARHPTALLTIEDLSSVVNMVNVDEEGESQGEDVMWHEEDDDSEETDIIYMSMSDMEAVERSLADNAFIHGRILTSGPTSALITMNTHSTITKERSFNGVTIDTAANRKSVMSEGQYIAYQYEFGRKIPIRAPKRGVRGIGGRSKVIGEVTIQIPFVELHLIIDVDFAILKEDSPSLLSNKDMIENGLDISLQGSYLYIGNLRQPLVLENYFFKYNWSSTSIPYVLYTEKELRTIHRSFGHPSVSSTYKLLRRASGDKLKGNIKGMLRRLSENCKICKTNAATPRRFKLTIGTDDLRFNNRIIVDTMFIEGRPVIHIVDECTHFTAASFLKSQSASEIWKSILMLWTHTYMGPPDFLAVDQGSAYISEEFKRNAAADGIIMEEAPIESPGSIGIVERYHAPLRSAYVKLRQTLSKGDVRDDECLRMAVYATNCTMGPEGLVPMLLVFGALPRPARTTPSPSQLMRQEAMEQAKKAVATEQAKRRLAFALRHPSSPKSKETSLALQNLPSGSLVLVYRTKSKRWEGPFRYISCEGETVVVQLQRGRRIFRTTCVKPWVKSNFKRNHDSPCDNDKEEDSEDDTNVYKAVTADENAADYNLGTVPRKVNVKRGSKEEEAFSQPRKDELSGLLRDGTFKPIRLTDIPTTARIFGSRFVDELKKVGDRLRKKSRLVAQNYADDGAASIATKAPTVQRFSQRVALSLAASMPPLEAYTRDITQAYIQSHTQLERDVHIRAPNELGLPPDYALKVVKPLYCTSHSPIANKIDNRRTNFLKSNIYVVDDKTLTTLGIDEGRDIIRLQDKYKVIALHIYEYITSDTHVDSIQNEHVLNTKNNYSTNFDSDKVQDNYYIVEKYPDEYEKVDQNKHGTIKYRAIEKGIVRVNTDKKDFPTDTSKDGDYNARDHHTLNTIHAQNNYSNPTINNDTSTDREEEVSKARRHVNETNIDEDCRVYLIEGDEADNNHNKSKDTKDTHAEYYDKGDAKVQMINEEQNVRVRYIIDQSDKIRRLEPADNSSDFISQRALAQYIGVNVRPDICAPVQLIAPGKNEVTDKDIKSLKKTTKFLKETIEQGLTFVPLNLETMRLVLMTDASFANAQGMKRQLGYLIMLVDDEGNCNIVHYGSNRCKRVARSVMAAEIQALVLGFDYAYVVKDLIEEILGRTIMLDAMVDSKTVFDVIAKDAKTTERRLQIDVIALRQSYDMGELNRLAWIPGIMNASDPLTKDYVLKRNTPLYIIMASNKFAVTPQGWAVSHEAQSSCSVDSLDGGG